MKIQLPKVTLTLTALAFLSACSGDAPSTGESPAPQSQPQTNSTPAPAPVETKPTPKPAKKGENYGTLKLKFGDEEVEVTTFKKLGTELIPTGPGAGIRLTGTDGEVFSLNYTVNDGEASTGEFVPLSATPAPEGKRIAMLSVTDFLKADAMVGFKAGNIKVTQCDADGNFAATFEGEASSMSDPNNNTLVPFSGSIDVKIP